MQANTRPRRWEGEGEGETSTTNGWRRLRSPGLKGAFKKHRIAPTPPERKGCFSSLSQRMIPGVRHYWQRLWPCSSSSDAAGNACTCASRAEWHPGNEQVVASSLHKSFMPSTEIQCSIFSVSKFSSFSCDGRTDRLLPCNISVGVCPGILSKLMPYHANLSMKGLV